MSLRGTLVPFSYCEMRILSFSSAESPDFSASSVCVKLEIDGQILFSFCQDIDLLLHSLNSLMLGFLVTI